MRFFLMLMALIVSPVALAHSHSLADLSIVERSSGAALAVHHHNGRAYIVGHPKHEYEIRIRNRSPHRLLAVTSVDGVNVITGETASEQQRGYVLEPYGSVVIDGWRKSLSEVARFYFTNLGDSYAARTGRENDVGVIGVALFRERIHPPRPHPRKQVDAPSAERRAEGPSTFDEADATLGTGHGTRDRSPARYVQFERGAHPDERLVLYYDSEHNLAAQGVLPRQPRLRRDPNPFPNAFAPDP